MTSRPEERRTAHEYDRWLREMGISATAMRLLMGKAGTYLVNTPFLGIPAEVGLLPNHRVLDVGCGRGGLAGELAQRAELLHDSLGVDISTAVLEQAARYLGPNRRVQLAAAAATRLPFKDGSFHLALAAYLFKYLEDDTLPRVLSEVHRVLAPGGILLGWEFAPTSSPALNRFHRWLLTRRVKTCKLRGFGALVPYALSAGFKYVDRLQFQLPFLFPPIPRVVVMLQKASA